MITILVVAVMTSPDRVPSWHALTVSGRRVITCALRHTAHTRATAARVPAALQANPAYCPRPEERPARKPGSSESVKSPV
jgi:hypothetical protein